MESHTKTPKTATIEQIEANKAKSIAEYKARHEAEAANRALLKAGVKYIHDRGLPVYFMEVNYPGEVYFTWENKNGEISFAYCFKSPKDPVSNFYTKGILGHRLSSSEDKYHHKMIDASFANLKDYEIAYLIGQSLVAATVIEKKAFPAFVIKGIREFVEMGRIPNIYCFSPRQELKRLPE